MHYLYLALANLLVGLLAGASICLFLAHQRANRLREQLALLSQEILLGYEKDPQAIFEPLSEKRMRWKGSLEKLTHDVEKGADRFVRLNALTSHRLTTLFDGLDKDPDILKILGYSSKEREKKATYEDVAVWTMEFRETINVRCFFELGVDSVRRRKQSEG